MLLCLPAVPFAADDVFIAGQGERLPAIALIIDDLGYTSAPGKHAISLPGPVAMSFLPGGKHTAELAQLAYANDKEVMLHLPMQALGQKARHTHDGELMVDMPQPEFIDTLSRNIAAVPHVSGINNHRGSLLTQTSDNMAWLMQALQDHGELFFIDSRTTAQTVAADTAQTYGVPSASRNVFLDNEATPQAIRKQFRELLTRARTDGTALAIGHPHPATLAVLAEELPRLAEQGLQLVPVSQLIERQKERRLAWQESSSR
ncbi:MAG: divergent polysaccharide deacetylase family protein [Gammaproteobacteria bacterium]